MKRFYSIAILVLCLFINAAQLRAQQQVIDSLTTLLQKSTAATDKGRLHIKIAREYLSYDTLKASGNLQKGFVYATQSSDALGTGMFHLYTSYMLCNKGLYTDGLTAFEKAAADFTQFLSNKNISATEKGEAEAMLLDAQLSRGNVYLELYEYEKAVTIFWSVLKLLEQANFPEKNAAIASTYQSIALAYYHRAQYETSLNYYLMAVPFAQKSGNERMAAESRIYAAMCYSLVKKYDSAFVLLQQAEPTVVASKDAGLKTSFYARKAEWCRFNERWQEAVQFYDLAIQNATVTSNTYMQATFMHAKARCLLKLGKINEARTAGRTALSLATSINKKREILESQLVLSMVEAGAGNYREAYQYLQQYKTGNDSLHTTELTEKIQTLDKKYQSAIKEEKIIQLQKDAQAQELINRKRQQLNYILAAGMLVLFVTGWLGYRTYQQKQKLQQHRITELETKQQLMATEAVLKGEEQERSRLAKDLHDGLGGMLSGIKYSLNTMKGNLIMTPENAQAFERSIDMLDNSIREMRRVAHNMMPEVLLRYGLDAALKDYTTEINKSGITHVVYESMGTESKQLDQSALLALYRVVQELLNNAMKHAAATEVLVQVFWENGKLVVNVEDNGKGFDASLLQQSEGMGWKNIRSRVELLKGTIDIHSAPGKGTAVNLEFSDLA